MKLSIYMDYAAATPNDQRVVDAMMPYFTKLYYNPSATYLAAQATREALDKARSEVAKILGAKPGEIIFTAGATEANNLAIRGIKQQFPDGEILVSAVEHDSVIEPALMLGAKLIPVNGDGSLNIAALSKMLNDKTVLISVGYVNNEIGTVQRLSAISKILNKYKVERGRDGLKMPLYLHTDAAQAGNFFDLQTSRLGVDLLTLNGGKIYGPKQSGVLYIKSNVKLKPQISGGGQEYYLRSGTENVPSDVGLARALQIADFIKRAEKRRVGSLRQHFIKELWSNFPDLTINGSANNFAPHIISATFPGLDNEKLVMQLDEAGIQAAVGSACSAGNQEPSHVLKAIGLDRDRIQSTIRFSLGRETTNRNISQVVDELVKITGHNR